MTLRSLPHALGAALVLIVMPCAAVIALQIYQALDRAPRLTQSHELVVHTFEVITTAQSLIQAVRDAERGVRRFVLSGEHANLDTYETAVPKIRPLLRQLKALTTNNPEQQRRLPNLEHQIDIQLKEFRNTVETRERDGFAAAQEMLRADANLDPMIAINGLTDGTIEAERAQLAGRLVQAAAEEHSTAGIALVSAGLALATMALGVVLAVLAFINARRIERARLAGEQRLSLLVESVADHALYILETDGRVADWNAGAQRLNGYSGKEIIGQHFSCFYTQQDRKSDLPQLALQIAADSGKYQTEGWRIRKDGSRFYASVVLSPLRDPNGHVVGFAKITRDMTERVHQQEQLEQARSALVQSQKMEALGQLTGGIAHDFNNLLHVMRNGVEILTRHLPDAEPTVQRHLDLVKRNVDRAAGVTQRLLAFSRQQPLEPRPLDLKRLVSGMVDLLRNALGEHTELVVAIGSGTWPVSADANQLEVAILNLAINARDAMLDGGKLTIESSNTIVDDSFAIAHPGLVPGEYAMLAVSDTGTGMSRETIARAFDPFFTTKASGLGTGLGLSQVFGFVKQSGGHVKIISEIGAGTTVKIYLPRLTSTVVEVTHGQGRVPAMPATESILVVEDDEEVRTFTA